MLSRYGDFFHKKLKKGTFVAFVTSLGNLQETEGLRSDAAGNRDMLPSSWKRNQRETRIGMKMVVISQMFSGF